jgi:hypothetical protein
MLLLPRAAQLAGRLLALPPVSAAPASWDTRALRRADVVHTMADLWMFGSADAFVTPTGSTFQWFMWRGHVADGLTDRLGAVQLTPALSRDRWHSLCLATALEAPPEVSEPVTAADGSIAAVQPSPPQAPPPGAQPEWQNSRFCHAIKWLALSRLPAKRSEETLAAWLANTTMPTQ